MSTVDTIAARTVDDGGCLRWLGSCINGHPCISVARRTVLVRRLLWERERGPIPPGRVLRCICGTPRCIALDCLRLTTYRAIAKECGAQGLMSGPVRSARIAAVKRAGKQAKVSQDDVRAIRASDESNKVLALRYGLNPATVWAIRRNYFRREFGAANPFAGLGA